MRALVTGGAKRLGKEMAIFLAERGFEVAIHYHSSENSAEELVKYIKSKTGKNSIALRADLTKEKEVQELITRANENLGGPISCLINNASIFEYDNIWTADRDSWDRHIESNLRAPLVLTQSFANQIPPINNDKNGERVSGSVPGLRACVPMVCRFFFENTKRNLYAGGVGYFTANKDFDTCIALRTALIKNNKIYVQAGAGIVADSNPENEYNETVNKAKALLKAID